MQSVVTRFIRNLSFFVSIVTLFSAGTAYAHYGTPTPTPTPTDPGDRCYAIADGHDSDSNGNANDTLLKMNRFTGATSSVNGAIPNMSTKNVEAMAFNATGTVLYVVNGSRLGTLDTATAVFTAKANDIGSVKGYFGSSSTLSTYQIHDIDGLSVDPVTGDLWASERRDSDPDLLIKIDTTSGKAATGTFGAADFVEIKPIGGLGDIDDISFDPVNGDLYAVMNDGGSGGKLVKVNKATGATTLIADMRLNTTNAIVDDIEGLSFFNDGQLYGSTGESGGTNKNKLFKINKATGQATLVGAFDANHDVFDIEGLACMTSQGKLSLEALVNGDDADVPTGPQVNAGSSVSLTYVVTNTGTRTLTNVAVTDSQQGSICTIPTLAAGESNVSKGVACQKTVSAITGQYSATATATAVDSYGTNYSVQDPANYLGLASYAISGKTLYQNSTTPISGVTVSSTGGLGSKTTDSQGAFSFSPVGNGSYTLTAAKTGYVVTSQNFTNPIAVNGASQTNKIIYLGCAAGYSFIGGQCVPVFSVSGAALLKGANTPIAGVTITATGQASQSTASNGTYTFTNVPNGSYTLAASKPGYVVDSQNFSNPVTVNGANQTNKNFILACAAGYAVVGGECQVVSSISGKVLFSGSNAAVSGATVTGTGQASLTTGSDGSYSFTNLPNGSYTVDASKSGLIVVSQNFTNPIVLNGSSVSERNFYLGCPQGQFFVTDHCVVESITLTASDGTYKDYVLVEWTPVASASSYTLYRSDVAGQLGSPIATTTAGTTTYHDTSAVPDQHYFYTAISNSSVTSNQDEGWRPADEICPTGKDCINEQLEPSACASANSFLGQVNIASVINKLSTGLSFKVEYRDLAGITRGSVQATIQSFQKMDFIINDLGLAPDTYGTVCVTADTTVSGAWSGGLTLYKSESRNGTANFGSNFDFALYYPFTNARSGAYTLPLNTYHLGVRADGTVANWVRITDAEYRDGLGLKGTLYFFGEDGSLVKTQDVDLNDGGRFDFSGHEAIGGADNKDAVGMVRFVPQDKPDGKAAKFYMSLGRYFYDCVGASCNNFYTAFAIPHRPGTNVGTSGGVSTVNGELSIVELNNISSELASGSLSVFAADGLSAGGMSLAVPALSTEHIIVNRNGANGFLENNTLASGTVTPETGMLSATSFFYKLDSAGELQYGYAAPLMATTGIVQVSEFNSFIEQTNEVEIYNTEGESISAQITAYDANHNVVLVKDISVPAHGTVRFALDVPKDTYGTVVLQAAHSGLGLRNYVSRPGEYVLPFPGTAVAVG